MRYRIVLYGIEMNTLSAELMLNIRFTQRSELSGKKRILLINGAFLKRNGRRVNCAQQIALGRKHVNVTKLFIDGVIYSHHHLAGIIHDERAGQLLHARCTGFKDMCCILKVNIGVDTTVGHDIIIDGTRQGY